MRVQVWRCRAMLQPSPCHSSQEDDRAVTARAHTLRVSPVHVKAAGFASTTVRAERSRTMISGCQNDPQCTTRRAVAGREGYQR